LFGIGFKPSQNDLKQLDPQAYEVEKKKEANRIKMSEFDYEGIEVDEDDDNLITNFPNLNLTSIYEREHNRSSLNYHEVVNEEGNQE